MVSALTMWGSSMFKEIDYNKHFVIGTVLVPWKVERLEHMAWLEGLGSIREKFPNAKFFAALEVDSRGIEAYNGLDQTFDDWGIDYWTYMINDKETNVTSTNRWIRIETGRNLIREFAQRLRTISGHHWGESTEQIGAAYEAVLYVDADMVLTLNHVEKLLEVDHPIVSVDVPAYGLHGKVVNVKPRIEEHWNTAGMLLVNAPAFYDLIWSHNNYLNLSDDPTFQSHAERLLRREGVDNLDTPYGMTWVRKDIHASHVGELIPVENRGIPDRVM